MPRIWQNGIAVLWTVGHAISGQLSGTLGVQLTGVTVGGDFLLQLDHSSNSSKHED
jgi:hypothetical protein